MGDDELDGEVPASTPAAPVLAARTESSSTSSTSSTSLTGKGLESLNLEERTHLSAVLGPGHEIVTVEKKRVVVRTDEVLMVNGTPINLEGEQGEKIKACLLNGTIPNQDLINHLLMKAGLFLKPVKQVMQAEITVSNVEKKCEAATVRQVKTNSTQPEGVISQGFSVTEKSHTFHDSQTIALNEDAEDQCKIQSSKTLPKTTTTEQHSLTYLEHLEQVLIQMKSADIQYCLLLWSRLYVMPSKILAQIQAKTDYFVQIEQPKRVSDLFDFVTNWITWFPEDFREEAAMLKLKKLFQLFQTIPEAAQCLAKRPHLITILSSHLSAMKKQQIFLTKTDQEPMDDLQLPPDAIVVAKELTRIELEYLSFLGPGEFINVFARESCSKSSDNINEDLRDVRIRSSQRTKNYDAYIDWFNHLSFLVASHVCKTRKKKHRARVIEFWIEVARVCVNIGNFNSLMGIITGLNMFPVSRLHKTWVKVQPGKFNVLEHQMDPTSNFLSYRSTLTAALVRSESATDDVQKIIIPFFTLFVKDLYTAKEELKLNSPKFDLNAVENISKTIQEFSKWKEVNCPFDRCNELATFLNQSVLDEERLDFESFEHEVPKNQSERDRYKALKDKFKKS